MKNQPNCEVRLDELELLFGGLRSAHPDDSDMKKMTLRPNVDLEVNPL